MGAVVILLTAVALPALVHLSLAAVSLPLALVVAALMPPAWRQGLPFFTLLSGVMLGLPVAVLAATAASSLWSPRPAEEAEGPTISALTRAEALQKARSVAPHLFPSRGDASP